MKATTLLALLTLASAQSLAELDQCDYTEGIEDCICANIEDVSGEIAIRTEYYGCVDDSQCDQIFIDDGSTY